jgi:hypothetical protein
MSSGQLWLFCISNYGAMATPSDLITKADRLHVKKLGTHRLVNHVASDVNEYMFLAGLLPSNII